MSLAGTPTSHIVTSLYVTTSRCRYLHPPTILLFHCMLLQVAVGTYTHQPYCYFTVWCTSRCRYLHPPAILLFHCMVYKSLSVLTPTNHIVISLYGTTSRCRYLHPPAILLFHCMVYKSLSVLTPTNHIVISLYGVQVAVGTYIEYRFSGVLGPVLGLVNINQLMYNYSYLLIISLIFHKTTRAKATE